MPAPVRTLPLFQVLPNPALIIGALYWTHTVLIPVALAPLFSFLVNPVVSMLQRRGLGRMPAGIMLLLRPLNVFLIWRHRAGP
jgi:predicted PurR-regulated permease PerM